jgi:hypothetical protein
METLGTAGSRWRIITTSLLTPSTPCEHSPYTVAWTARAHLDVEPTSKMFSVPSSAPLVGATTRPFTSMRVTL